MYTLMNSRGVGAMRMFFGSLTCRLIIRANERLGHGLLQML